MQSQLLHLIKTNNKFILNEKLNKLSLRERINLYKQILKKYQEFHTTKSAAISFDSILMRITDPLIMYFYHREAKEEYNARIEQWKNANKPGSILFVYSRAFDLWQVYYIDGNEKDKMLQHAEIDNICHPTLRQELRKINSENALTFDTKNLHGILKTQGSKLYRSYVHQKPKYETSATVLNFAKENHIEQGLESNIDTLKAVALALFGATDALKNKRGKFEEIKQEIKNHELDQDATEYLRLEQSLSPEVSKTPFVADGLLDLHVPGFSDSNINIKSLYFSFFNRIADPEQPDIEKEYEFTDTLHKLAVAVEKNETKENLYPLLAKLILMSHIWQPASGQVSNTAEIDNIIKNFDFSQNPKICKYVVVDPHERGEFNIQTFVDSVNNIPKKIETYAQEMLEKFQSAIIDNTEIVEAKPGLLINAEIAPKSKQLKTVTVDIFNKNGKRELIVTEHEKRMLDAMKKAAAKKTSYRQSLINFQRTLYQTRRHNPPETIFHAPEIADEILEAQAEMELRAKNTLIKIQDVLFTRTTNKAWHSNYFSSEYTHISDQKPTKDQPKTKTKKYKIDKDATILLDHIANAQEKDFGYMAALIGIEHELTQMQRDKRLSKKHLGDKEFFEALTAMCVIGALSPKQRYDLNKKNEPRSDNTYALFPVFEKELDGFFKINPSFYANSKVQDIYNSVQTIVININQEKFDVALKDTPDLLDKINNYIRKPSFPIKSGSAFFTPHPEQELYDLLVNNSSRLSPLVPASSAQEKPEDVLGAEKLTGLSLQT